MTRRAIPYLDAVGWIADNDDTSWIGDEVAGRIIPSTTACLVADIYGRSTEEVAADLRIVMRGRTFMKGPAND